jgi:integrase
MEWYDYKKSGKTKQPRAATLKGIEETTETLKTIFAGKRVLEVTTADINWYLDKLGLKIGLRRKFNIRSRLSQFFNWCISRGHAATNPCDKIEIHVNGKDEIAIFTPAEALRLLTLCREKPEFKDLVLYHAISLFAGLRPSECQLLTWENVNLKEKTLTVHSKPWDSLVPNWRHGIEHHLHNAIVSSSAVSTLPREQTGCTGLLEFPAVIVLSATHTRGERLRGAGVKNSTTYAPATFRKTSGSFGMNP